MLPNSKLSLRGSQINNKNAIQIKARWDPVTLFKKMKIDKRTSKKGFIELNSGPENNQIVKALWHANRMGPSGGISFQKTGTTTEKASQHILARQRQFLK